MEDGSDQVPQASPAHHPLDVVRLSPSEQTSSADDLAHLLGLSWRIFAIKDNEWTAEALTAVVRRRPQLIEHRQPFLDGQRLCIMCTSPVGWCTQSSEVSCASRLAQWNYEGVFDGQVLFYLLMIYTVGQLCQHSTKCSLPCCLQTILWRHRATSLAYYRHADTAFVCPPFNQLAESACSPPPKRVGSLERRCSPFLHCRVRVEVLRALEQPGHASGALQAGTGCLPGLQAGLPPPREEPQVRASQSRKGCSTNQLGARQVWTARGQHILVWMC